METRRSQQLAALSVQPKESDDVTLDEVLSKLEQSDFGFRCSTKNLKRFVERKDAFTITEDEEDLSALQWEHIKVILYAVSYDSGKQEKLRRLLRECYDRSVPAVPIFPHQNVTMPNALAVAIRDHETALSENDINDLQKLADEVCHTFAGTLDSLQLYTSRSKTQEAVDIGSIVSGMRNKYPSSVVQGWENLDPTKLASTDSPPRFVVIYPSAGTLNSNSIFGVFEYQRILAREGVPCFVMDTSSPVACDPVVVTKVPDTKKLRRIYDRLECMACYRQMCRPREERLVIETVKASPRRCVKSGWSKVLQSLDDERARLVVILARNHDLHYEQLASVLQKCHARDTPFVVVSDYEGISERHPHCEGCSCLCLCPEPTKRESPLNIISTSADFTFTAFIKRRRQRSILDMIDCFREHPSRSLLEDESIVIPDDDVFIYSCQLNKYDTGGYHIKSHEQVMRLIELAETASSLVPLGSSDEDVARFDTITASTSVVIRSKEFQACCSDSFAKALFQRIREVGCSLYILDTFDKQVKAGFVSSHSCYVLSTNDTLDALADQAAGAKTRAKIAATTNSATNQGYRIKDFFEYRGSDPWITKCDLPPDFVSFIKRWKFKVFNKENYEEIKDLPRNSVVVIRKSRFETLFSRNDTVHICRNLTASGARFILCKSAVLAKAGCCAFSPDSCEPNMFNDKQRYPFLLFTACIKQELLSLPNNHLDGSTMANNVSAAESTALTNGTKQLPDSNGSNDAKKSPRNSSGAKKPQNTYNIKDFFEGRPWVKQNSLCQNFVDKFKGWKFKSLHDAQGIEEIRKLPCNSVVVIRLAKFQSTFSKQDAVRILRNLISSNAQFMLFKRKVKYPEVFRNVSCCAMIPSIDVSHGRLDAVGREQSAFLLSSSAIKHELLALHTEHSQDAEPRRSSASISFAHEPSVVPPLDSEGGDVRVDGKSLHPQNDRTSSQSASEGVEMDFSCTNTRELAIEQDLLTSSNQPGVASIEDAPRTGKQANESASDKCRSPAETNLDRYSAAELRREQIKLEEEEVALQSAVYDLTNRIEAVEDTENDVIDEKSLLETQLSEAQSEVERLATTLEQQQEQQNEILNEIAALEGQLKCLVEEDGESVETWPTASRSYSYSDEDEDGGHDAIDRDHERFDHNMDGRNVSSEVNTQRQSGLPNVNSDAVPGVGEVSRNVQTHTNTETLDGEMKCQDTPSFLLHNDKESSDALPVMDAIDPPGSSTASLGGIFAIDRVGSMSDEQLP